MKLTTLLSQIATAIASDAAIETFCQTNFSKSISIYVHVDPKNPPPISKAPWVGLTIQAYQRPTDQNALIVNFDLDSAIFLFDDASATSGKITTMGGFAKIEDLSDLVFLAIENAISLSSLQLNMTYNSEQVTQMTIADYPGWIASRTWTVSKHV